MAVAPPQPDVIQSKIKTAMRSRIVEFNDQLDSLTFAGARRLLEKDLGLEPGALDLDFHKKFVKEQFSECVKALKTSEIVEKDASTTGEAAESREESQPKKDVMDPRTEEKEKMEDSTEENKEFLMNELKEAIRKRASYVDNHTDFSKVSLADLFRLLEKDMKLDEYDLDPFKKFITKQFFHEMAVLHPEVLPSINTRKCFQSKASRKSSSKKSSDSPKHDNGVKDEEDGDKEEEEEEIKEEERFGREINPKKKYENFERLDKRKIPEKETNAPSKKRIREAEKVADNGSDAEETRIVSEGGRIQSSVVVKAAVFDSGFTKQSLNKCGCRDSYLGEIGELKKQCERLRLENDVITIKNRQLMTDQDGLFECVSSLKLKNKELTKAKELAEEAKRQAEKTKEEAERAKEEAEKAKNKAEKSIAGFKSKTSNMEQHIADLQRQLDEARASVSVAMDDFKASEVCDELLVNLVGPYMEGAFHNFQVQAIANFPQLEKIFKNYKLDYDMIVQAIGTDDE